nr:mucin-5B [Danio rerio]|eukprot:XP_021333301.1 mucin-5B [Danio rerio]
MNLIPTATIEMVAGLTSQHNELICSTWGNYHYKTFDGDYFQLPSTCNYILTSHCSSSYEDFNVQLRHELLNNEPTVSKITMKLQGTIIELSRDSLSVNGQTVTLPYSSAEVFIERVTSYISIKAALGLVAMWNEDDSFMIRLDEKYRNQTCGLCGDFNGIPVYNEFVSGGSSLSVSDYGNLWKLDGPTETCTEDTMFLNENCGDENFCRDIFSSPVFSDCRGLVSIDSFVQVCIQDLCHCNSSSGAFCLCDTIAEYSRQCVHAGGKPEEWRTEYFCRELPHLCSPAFMLRAQNCTATDFYLFVLYITAHPCPETMVYSQCGNPCTDTCTNSERGQVCAQHCIDGCFCPPGLTERHRCFTYFSVFKVHPHCLLLIMQCLNKSSFGHCYFSFSTCDQGQWDCYIKDCPHSCSVEGGSHITTFDGKAYTFHGDCTYVLSKVCTSLSLKTILFIHCSGTEFTVLGDLVKCGLTETETCLKAITVALFDGITFPASVSVFKPSSFYIIIEAPLIGLRLEIQLVPIMQLYITANSVYQGETCGLCGNYNNMEADDFTTIGGLREGTALDFANTWKTRASCPDVKRSFENPCSLSTENEQYAQHWCSLLSDSSSVFAPCHTEVNPEVYKANCIYDSCNCERSEDCMCAALSSYAHACAARGILLEGWRDAACMKYTETCAATTVYSYQMTSCGRTCRSLSQADGSCTHDHVLVDGCGCAEGKYMNENGDCVEAAACSCYDSGKVVALGETISKDGGSWYAHFWKLSCSGVSNGEGSLNYNLTLTCNERLHSECVLYMDCMQISTGCVSGCVCPSGLVSDGNGGCIDKDQCPCIHNGHTYQSGESIKIDCNTCSCQNRRWTCTTNQCSATCSIYGDGHYRTFDDKRYVFSGNCEYSLVQDFCNSTSGTFRVITENIPCGSTGTTCSKAIKLFLGSNELRLTDGSFQVVRRDAGEEIPYQMRTMGLYLVIETKNGLMLIWDRKTTIHIKLGPEYNGRVCGLCGNYDGNANNDFTTRTQAVAVQALDFANSWKLSSCPDATLIQDPCAHNPYREAWAQRQCSIITSSVFSACHSQVDPSPFYDACVRDACACDSGGDYECFCTAVTAYAQACNEAGACVAWRSPKICPLFCDYYNPPGECEWHYKPCGAPCMKTCRNPDEQCSNQIPALEGCYPQCPQEQPVFDEDNMKCVKQEECGCFVDMEHYEVGEQVPTTENCQSWYVCIFNLHTFTTLVSTTVSVESSTEFEVSTQGPSSTTKPIKAETTLSTTTAAIPSTTFSVVEGSTTVQPSAPSILSTTSKSSTVTETTGVVTTTETVTENELSTSETTLSTTRPPKVVTTSQTIQPTTTATTTVEELTATSPESSTPSSTSVPLRQTSPAITSTQPTTLTKTTAVPVTTLVSTTVSVESSTEFEVSTQSPSSTTKPIKAETTLSTTTAETPSTTVLVEGSSTVQKPTETSAPSILSTTSKSSTVTETTGVVTTTETVTENELSTSETTLSTSRPPKVVTTGQTIQPTTTATTTVEELTATSPESSTPSSTSLPVRQTSPAITSTQPTTVTKTTAVPVTTLVSTTVTVESSTEFEVSTQGPSSTTKPIKAETTLSTTTAETPSTTVLVEGSSTVQHPTETSAPSILSTTSKSSTSTETTGVVTTTETVTENELSTSETTLSTTRPPKVVTTGQTIQPTTTATTTVGELTATSPESSTPSSTSVPLRQTSPAITSTQPTTLTKTTAVPVTTLVSTTVSVESSTEFEVSTQSPSSTTKPIKAETTLSTTTAETPSTTVLVEGSSTVQQPTETSAPSILSTTSKSSTVTETIGVVTTTETVTENELSTSETTLSTTRPPKVVTTGQTIQPTTTATTTVEELTATSPESSTPSSTSVPLRQTSPAITSTQPTTLTKTTAVPVTTLVSTTVSVESSTEFEVSTQGPSSTTKPIKAETTLSTTTAAIPSTTFSVVEGSTTVQPSAPSILSTTSKSSTVTETTGVVTTTETVTENELSTSETTLSTTRPPKVVTTGQTIQPTTTATTTVEELTATSPESSTPSSTSLPVRQTSPAITSTQPTTVTKTTAVPVTTLVSTTVTVESSTEFEVSTQGPSSTTKPIKAETTLSTTTAETPSTTVLVEGSSTVQHPTETSAPSILSTTSKSSTSTETTGVVTTTETVTENELSTSETTLSTTRPPKVVTTGQTIQPTTTATTTVEELTATSPESSTPSSTSVPLRQTSPAITSTQPTTLTKTTAVPVTTLVSTTVTVESSTEFEVSTQGPSSTTKPIKAETTLSTTTAAIPSTTFSVVEGSTTVQPSAPSILSTTSKSSTATETTGVVTTTETVTENELSTSETTLSTTRPPKVVTTGQTIQPTTTATTTVEELTATSPDSSTPSSTSLPVRQTSPAITSTQPTTVTKTTAVPVTTLVSTTVTVESSTEFEVSTQGPSSTTKPIKAETTLSTTTAETPSTTVLVEGSSTVQQPTETSAPSILSTTSKSSTVTETTGVVTTTETVTENELSTSETTLSTTRPPKVVTTGQTIQPTTTATTTVEELTATSPESSTPSSTSVPLRQTSPAITSTQPTTLTKTTAVPVTTLVSTTVSVESSTEFEVSTQGPSSTTKPIKAETTLSTTTAAIPSTTFSVVEGSTTVQPSAPSILSTTSKSSTVTETTGVVTTTETVTENELSTSETTLSTTRPPKVVTTGQTIQPTTTATTTSEEGTTLETTKSTISPVVTTNVFYFSTSMETSIAPITKTLPFFTLTIPVTTDSSLFSTTSEFCCFVNETNFHSGDIIYNVTDGFGWCFTAYCDESCNIVKISTSCVTSPSPSIPPETTTYSSSSTAGTNEPETIISTTNTITEETTPSLPRCDAIDPPRQPNEAWWSECQKCECDSQTLTVICRPVNCPVSPPITCDKPGQMLITVATVDCCEIQDCTCNSSLCPTPPQQCQPGFTLTPVITADACCPEYTCSPMEVCVQNNTVYQPGSNIPSDDPCTQCLCGQDTDPETNLLAPECHSLACMMYCPEETHEYRKLPGQCCGECVSTECVVVHDNITVNIPVNQTWQPDDKCLTYRCERNNGVSMPVEIKTVCPAFNPEDCIPGTETLDADGCCPTCTLENKCTVQKNSTFLVSKGCKSSTPVEITSCSGLCGTSSIYSAEANALVHSCSCCQETTTSTKEVTLNCPDGSNISFSYIYIESCGCKASNCPDQSTNMRRRRRRK